MSLAWLSPPSIANGVIAGSVRHTSAIRTGIPAQRKSNDACKAKAAEETLARVSAVFPREKQSIYEAPVAFACSCFKRIRKERFSGVIAIWFFARQPPNCSVERGFLTFYRFLQLAEGQFAPSVERIPDRSGSLADFFFHCGSFSFAQSSPREYTPHLRPNDAGEACSSEPDLKVV